MTGLNVQFGALTDVGRKREHNEDNYLVDQSLGLFIVCDGMGGHAAGEVASAIAVRVVHEEVKRASDLIEDFNQEKSGVDHVSKRDIFNMLEFAVNRASSRVHEEAQNDVTKRGMGTTLVAILIANRHAFMIYVGDSRIYMLREGLLEQLTEDHTVYNELVRRKKMKREQADQLAQKNAITRAVGVYEHVEPETVLIDLIAGDRFLLCSDGLSGYFEEDLERLGQYLTHPDARESTQKLVDYANEMGGKDNITAVLVTVGDGDPRDEGRAKKLKLQRDLLAKMSLFRPLNDREILRVLQVTEVVAFAADKNIVREGENGEELFIMLEGEAKVVRNKSDIATLKPGDHFGELALVRQQPRSATVRCATDCEVIILTRSDFFEILRKEHQLAVKLLWQFLGALGDRLAATSRQLGEARQELEAEYVTPDIFEDEDDDGTRKTAILPPAPASQNPEELESKTADSQEATVKVPMASAAPEITELQAPVPPPPPSTGRIPSPPPSVNRSIRQESKDKTGQDIES